MPEGFRLVKMLLGMLLHPQSFASHPPLIPKHLQEVKSLLDRTYNLRKVQELESKFNDAYTQSLSTKDERIQVLEKRVEATIKDNTQLREDLMAIRKQNERLKERMNRLSSGTISPQISPGHSLMLSARADRDASKDHSSTQSDSAKLRERVVELQEKVGVSGCVCWE